MPDLCSLIKDLSAALHLIMAVVRVRGPATKIHEGRIEALSVRRVIWFVGVQLVRMAVAISLGYGGARLLCKTIHLEGLLRTTVALKCARARAHARMRACVHAHIHACVRVCVLMLYLCRDCVFRQ